MIPLKLLNYLGANQQVTAGVLIGTTVFPLQALLSIVQAQSSPERSVLEVLDDWLEYEPLLQAGAKLALEQHMPGEALATVQLLAPLLYPGAVYCAGANYSDHVIEMARLTNLPPDPDPRELGLKPWHFLKPSRSCVVASGATIRRPVGCQKLDWEAELVAVIGRTARDVSVADALRHVAGYTMANDLSARDLSRRHPLAAGSPFRFDWTGHKGFDGSCPLGPWITPAQQVKDPQNMSVKLWVNDIIKQDSNTSQMIFSVAEQIAHLSTLVTLHPGDIVLTGTPAGVGAARGEFLQPGDRVVVEIEGLGQLESHIA